MRCDECGDEYEPTANRPTRRFCSRACQKRWSNRQRPGKGRSLIPRPCEACGVTMRPTRDGFGGARRYCSVPCRRIAWRRRQRKYRMGQIGRHSALDFVRMQRRYGGLCAYCGEQPGDTRDHVLPVTRGGSDSIGNILPACAPCNSSKGTRLLAEWRYASRRVAGGFSTP